MGSTFEGFEGCFTMSISSTNYDTLKLLRNTNDRREHLNIKIAKGTVTRFNMMNQLKAELQIFDVFLKKIDSKKKKNECCAMINSVISVLTKRINNMWNTIFLLFTIDDELEPEFLNVARNFIMSSCTNCRNCNVTVESIISNIEIISIQENTIFNFSSSDFIKILQTTAFVDKTLMIKEVFFRNKEIKGLVITAPRKYGKSTNLSMLKYFLEIQVDSLGKPLSKASAEKPVTNTSNYKLFKGLKIGKEVNIMNQHFGKYPVLYANFKIEKNIKTYICVIQGVQEIIHKSFQLHNYLQKSSKLSVKQRRICKLWCCKSYKKLKDVDETLIGFRLLCAFLTKHYNKPCFVLIDNVDFFTKTVTITETLLEDYEIIVLFMRKILLFLNNNQLVVKTFVTGKTGYAIHSIMPSCILIQPFYKFHRFTDYYGLTTNELEYLFKKPVFKDVSLTIKEVKAYYGSYNKIDPRTKIKKEIYCIWSILNVLKCKRLDNYWRDFGNFFCALSNPTIKNTMQLILINDHNMLAVFYPNSDKKSLPINPIVIATSGIPTKKSLDYFYHILMDLGYLTTSPSSVLVQTVHNNISSCIGYVEVPNKEVRDDIVNKISLLS